MLIRFGMEQARFTAVQFAHGQQHARANPGSSNSSGCASATRAGIGGPRGRHRELRNHHVPPIAGGGRQ